jgi:hypothetical protein
MEEEEEPGFEESFGFSIFRRRVGSSAPSDTRSSRNLAFGSSGSEGIQSASDGLVNVSCDADEEVEEEEEEEANGVS